MGSSYTQEIRDCDYKKLLFILSQYSCLNTQIFIFCVF